MRTKGRAGDVTLSSTQETLKSEGTRDNTGPQVTKFLTLWSSRNVNSSLDPDWFFNLLHMLFLIQEQNPESRALSLTLARTFLRTFCYLFVMQIRLSQLARAFFSTLTAQSVIIVLWSGKSKVLWRSSQRFYYYSIVFLGSQKKQRVKQRAFSERK